MKTRKLLVPLTFLGAIVSFTLPARGDTMSVPSAANARYTLEAPGTWKPVGNPSDESVEAASPDDHAYLMAWIVKDSDDSEQKALRKDLTATLKDSMKSIDGEPSMHELDQNGTHFYVFNGSGVDKREGTKVKFLVGIFDAGGGYAGIVYADASANAPDSTMNVLEGILKSIKVKK